jgi:hypothetical protein
MAGTRYIMCRGIYYRDDNMSYPIEARIYQIEMDMLYRSWDILWPGQGILCAEGYITEMITCLIL